MIWQDLGQISRVYGDDGASTVLGNSGCVFVFGAGPVDNKTAEFLSQAAGQIWRRAIRASDDPNGGPPRIDVSAQAERLWSPEAIRSLPECHGLVWQSGAAIPQPVVCPPYWELDFCAGRYDRDPFHTGPYPVMFGRARPAPAHGGNMMHAAVVVLTLLLGTYALAPHVAHDFPHFWRGAVAPAVASFRAGEVAMSNALGGARR
jgi:hypothetical protein